MNSVTKITTDDAGKMLECIAANFQKAVSHKKELNGMLIEAGMDMEYIKNSGEKDDVVINFLIDMAGTILHMDLGSKLSCLAIAIGSIMNEYGFGTKYVTVEGLVDIAQKIENYYHENFDFEEDDDNDFEEDDDNDFEKHSLQPDESKMVFTHGRLTPCPYCGSNGINTYTDGTAQCYDCGKWFRYAY